MHVNGLRMVEMSGKEENVGREEGVRGCGTMRGCGIASYGRDV